MSRKIRLEETTIVSLFAWYMNCTSHDYKEDIEITYEYLNYGDYNMWLRHHLTYKVPHF